MVGRKGMKQIPSQYNGTAKECVTVLPCGNAAGLQLKLLALYSGKLHLKSRLEDTFNMCYHAVNESGYMDQLIFANYIKEVVFHEKVGRPLLSCEQPSTCSILPRVFPETGRRVEIFCFPSGQTSRLQPFNVAAFGGIKYRWNKYLRDRRVKTGGPVTKDTVLSHLVMLWFRTDGFPPEFAFNAGTNLKSGFAQCGLFPFNPDMIRQSSLTPIRPSFNAESVRFSQR
ncbi:hypothetical protein RvY_19194-3 [Ramazzottius varieornatus]|uniref:DDE-1 domain-containing protein n=1 Tax=Ramazzottius varieornatus TaxID=947166 RepID=A0A1D1W8K8_RAMVA|nr:hypothetical protein RvY_19194-3 [Ramazzottius varieornatus]